MKTATARRATGGASTLYISVQVLETHLVGAWWLQSGMGAVVPWKARLCEMGLGALVVPDAWVWVLEPVRAVVLQIC